MEEAKTKQGNGIRDEIKNMNKTMSSCEKT